METPYIDVVILNQAVVARSGSRVTKYPLPGFPIEQVRFLLLITCVSLCLEIEGERAASFFLAHADKLMGGGLLR